LRGSFDDFRLRSITGPSALRCARHLFVEQWTNPSEWARTAFLRVHKGLCNLVDQFVRRIYHQGMNQQVTIEEPEMTPEMARLFEQAERNMVWLSEHAEELEIFKRYRGRYVAAAGGELFVADTPEEVERLAREKHPDEMPHVRYIFREKRSRIYACQRKMDAL
jgi:Family of unknown function (DUF5678)